MRVLVLSALLWGTWMVIGLRWWARHVEPRLFPPREVVRPAAPEPIRTALVPHRVVILDECEDGVFRAS
jgi:hypothetical protein